MQLFYIFITIFAAILAVGFVISVKQNRSIRKNGTEADAVVSKIEEYDPADGDDGMVHTYFVRFRTQDRREVEAKLGGILQKRYHVGDELHVIYLSEKPDYAVP